MARHLLAEHGRLVNYNGDHLEQSSSLSLVLLLAVLYKLLLPLLPAGERSSLGAFDTSPTLPEPPARGTPAPSRQRPAPLRRAGLVAIGVSLGVLVLALMTSRNPAPGQPTTQEMRLTAAIPSAAPMPGAPLVETGAPERLGPLSVPSAPMASAVPGPVAQAPGVRPSVAPRERVTPVVSVDAARRAPGRPGDLDDLLDRRK